MPEGCITVQQWAEYGRRLGTVGRAAGWWLGDWLLYGNARFGERYTRAARITGYDAQTLMNFVYVVSRYPPAERRAALSFSHHAELAALEPVRRREWLDRAERERLSVRALRTELRRVQRAAVTVDAVPAADPAQADMICPHCGFHISTHAAAEGDAYETSAEVYETSAEGEAYETSGKM